MNIRTKLLHLPKEARDKFAGMTMDEKIAEVRKDESKMSIQKHNAIQAFVQEQLKKGIKVRKIKKMVKEKFKVVLI